MIVLSSFFLFDCFPKLMSTAAATSESLLVADRPFLAFLLSQNEFVFQQLYERRHCVIAVFRMLPQLAQQCLLQMMFRKSNDWRASTNKRYQMAVVNALQLLLKLKILEGELDDELQINIDFRMNYISSLLTSPFQLTKMSQHPLDDKSKRAANKDLLGKSVERWESILCYLALPNDAADKGVSETTRALFHFMGLIKGSAREPEISSVGFQFLLLSRTEQIWNYLISYWRFLASREEDILPVLDFFLQLTLCIQPPNEAQIRPLVLDPGYSEQIQAFVLTLREIGLIFIRKRKDGWFLLTPLMTQIAQETSGTDRAAAAPTIGTVDPSKASSSSGFLIVETNYRVYAYTNSTLQLAILSTFAEMFCRFQDIAIGILTRDSIRRALQTGITAHQICQYLRANVHPQMQAQPVSGTVIPITVIDQIHLWEQERKRFTYNEGIAYSSFDSEADFVAFRDFTSENQYSLWHCNISRMVIIDSEWEDVVKQWWNEHKAKTVRG